MTCSPNRMNSRLVVGYAKSNLIGAQRPQSKPATSFALPQSSNMRNMPAIQNYLSNVHVICTEESCDTVLSWTIEKFYAVLLEGKKMCLSPRARKVDERIALLSEMCIEFVECVNEDGYFTVMDLVRDVELPGFSDDLFEFGLKDEYFLDEVLAILQEFRIFVNNKI